MGMAKKRVLKRTTEAFIMAAQEQAKRTNNIKAKIDKTPPPQKKKRNVECVEILKSV